MISCAAMAMDCKPDEQKRLTVAPATVTGSPAADGGDPGDVHPLRTLGIAAAQHDVFDIGRIQAPAPCRRRDE